MSTNIALPPGPKGGLLMGNMREFQADPLNFLTRCARNYGDIVRLRFLYVPVLLLSHPEHVDFVMSTSNRNFIKGISLKTPFLLRLVGNGLLTSEGDFWLRQRRLSQPAFHRERINSYADIAVSYTSRMLDSWQDGETRDVHQDMMHLTLEVAAKSLFDVDVAAGEAADVRKALEVVVKPFASQATIKWILDNRLPTPGNRRFHRACETLDRIIYRIISERRAEHREDRGDLLSMLLHAQDEDGTRMTDQQLRDEVMTLFLAGHDTTAIALSWAWHLLIEHPHVEAKLVEELREVLDGRAPTLADIPRLRYTEMIIKETMRLYPPAWGVAREAVRDCEIGGYRVAKGTQLMAFQWVIQRDARFFERPEEFEPERWTDDFARRLPKFAYFPFGGGPRVCIGNAFAMMEAVLLLASIAQRFHFKAAPNHAAQVYPTLTLRPKNGVKVILQRR